MVTARTLLVAVLAGLLITSAITASAAPVHAQSDLSDDEEDDEVSDDDQSDESAENSLGAEATDRIDGDDVLRRQQGTNVHEIVAELEAGAGSGKFEKLPEGFRADLADIVDKYDGRRGDGWKGKLTGDLKGLLEKYQDDFASKYQTDDGLPVTELPDGEMTEEELREEASNQGRVMGGIDWGASVRVRWGNGDGPVVDVKVHAGGKSTPWMGHNDPTEDVKKEFNELVQGEDESGSTEGVEDFGSGGNEGEDTGGKDENGEKTGGTEEKQEESEKKQEDSEKNEDSENEKKQEDSEKNEDSETEGESDESEKQTDQNGETEESGESESEDSGTNGESGESGGKKGEDAEDKSGKNSMPSSPVGPGGGGTGCRKTMTCDQSTGNVDFDADDGNDVAEECKAMQSTGPGEDCKRPGENDGRQPVEVGNHQHEQCKYMSPTGPGDGCDFDGASEPNQDATNLENQCKYMGQQDRRNCDDLSVDDDNGNVEPSGGSAQLGGNQFAPGG